MRTKTHTQRPPPAVSRPEGYFADAYKDTNRIAFEEAMGRRLQPEYRAEIEWRIKGIDSSAVKGVDAFEALKEV